MSFTPWNVHSARSFPLKGMQWRQLEPAVSSFEIARCNYVLVDENNLGYQCLAHVFKEDSTVSLCGSIQKAETSVSSMCG